MQIFFLFRTTIDEYVDYSLKNTDALLSRIQYSKPTVLYIHGYTEHLEKESVQTVVQGIFRHQIVIKKKKS